MIDVEDAMTEGGLSELVRNRRSIRAFRPDPIPRDLLEEILRDVVWAPSPHNSQPWRFTVLFDEGDKTRLAEAMAERLQRELTADGVAEEVISRQTLRSRDRITSAPGVVLCSLVGEGLVSYRDERRTSLEWQMAVQSVGAALQTLFLCAETRGIGTCWMAAPMYCPDEVRSAVKLPQSYEPQALVLLGYAAHPGKVRDRRSFEEVVDFR